MASKEIMVPSGNELSIHFELGSLILLGGAATIFGASVRPNAAYHFEDKGIPLVSTGASPARVQVQGSFTEKQTVAQSSAKELHLKLNEKRREAMASESGSQRGPVVIIVGEQDTGKSSLCKSLINYATSGSEASSEEGYGVAFVDVDVGQNAITVPGSIAACFCEGPLPIDEDFNTLMPLAFYFGDKTVNGGTSSRYLDICSYAEQCCTAVGTAREKYRHGGLIINTMGWVTGLGYELIRQMIDVFKVTDIVVTGNNENLLKDIGEDAKATGKPLAVHSLNRSPSLYVRSRGIRSNARSRQILTYFTGTKRTPMAPCRLIVQLKDIVLLNAETLEPMNASDVKPLGLCAISHAPHIESVRSSNVAGFVVVLEVGKTNIALLAPSPGKLPRNILLVSNQITLQMKDVPPVL